MDTILIADDDLDDVELLVEFLTNNNYRGTCMPFQNGRLLLDYLEKENVFPQLIILDLNMPVMDGFQTLIELKSNIKYKSIPVIVLSTSDYVQDRKKCYQLGCHKFFSKPSTVADYASIARNILGDTAI